MTELDEPILDIDHPVHAGYAYVADAKPIISDVSGEVRHLMMDTGARVIRRCDLVGRGLV